MHRSINRRDFLKLTGLGGVVFASGLAGGASYAASKASDFHFVQLSDSHWGFSGPAVNPEAGSTLKRAVAAVNSLAMPPDFIIFTGDLTHTTDDPQIRRTRMREFKAIVADLNVRNIHFLPGEHDASLDHGAAFQEFFGPTHYSFDYQGVHFVVLDNVSDPAARVGEEQLAWLKSDLTRHAKDAPIVVLTHRPLFDLAPQWDWATRDGSQVVDLLMPYENVTVFYGHIHQEHHHMTGHIAHHAARSLIFPLPAPGSQPKREPVKWDPEHPFRGLGFRSVAEDDAGRKIAIDERPLAGG
ncbi:MAG TPA: metallophosphoesterase [Thiobacillaceae bacterium]|nr:metallophosphoesterase [Thiobacillaceae bacterium]